MEPAPRPVQGAPGEDRWWEDEDSRSGPEVPPGLYTVTVAYTTHKATGSVNVLPDPRLPVNDLFAKDVAVFRQKVQTAGIVLLEDRPPLAVP